MNPLSRVGANLAGLFLMLVAAPTVLLLMVLMNRLTKPKEEKLVRRDEVTFDLAPTTPKSGPASREDAPRTQRRIATSGERLAVGHLAALAPGVGGGIDVGLPDLFVDPKAPIAAGALSDLADVVHTEATVDRKPVPRTKGPIDAPPVARTKNLSGRVVVMMLIGTDGLVKAVRVRESEPKGVFDDSVTQAVRTWTFEPALYKSQPVEMWATLSVQFSP